MQTVLNALIAQNVLQGDAEPARSVRGVRARRQRRGRARDRARDGIRDRTSGRVSGRARATTVRGGTTASTARAVLAQGTLRKRKALSEERQEQDIDTSDRSFEVDYTDSISSNKEIEPATPSRLQQSIGRLRFRPAM